MVKYSTMLNLPCWVSMKPAATQTKLYKITHSLSTVISVGDISRLVVVGSI